jgi:hypothetical protein
VLAEHSWTVYRSRARSPRTYEVSPDGTRWRSLTIKDVVRQRATSLRGEERLEVVVFGEGRALVRAPGSEVIVAGALGPAGRSASDSVARTAGVQTPRVGGGKLLMERAFVLVGGALNYDVLDLDGWPLGSISSKTAWRTTCTVRDRSQHLVLTVRKRIGRWSASDEDGREIVKLRRRWGGASEVFFDAGAPDATALPAVRATGTSQPTEERVGLPTGERMPKRQQCWTLLGTEDDEIARVTKVGAHFAVEILVDVDPAEALVLVAEIFLVLLDLAPKPSGGGA